MFGDQNDDNGFSKNSYDDNTVIGIFGAHGKLSVGKSF